MGRVIGHCEMLGVRVSGEVAGPELAVGGTWRVDLVVPRQVGFVYRWARMSGT